MKKIIARTILTFDISDPETYTDFVKILTSLRYQDGKDQSTRIHERSVRNRTLADINQYCKEYEHGFTETDRICFANPELRTIDGESFPVIVHREFHYNPDEDAFT